MKQKKIIIWSTVISIGMLVFSYWITNLQFPISGEKEVISIFEAIRGVVYDPSESVESGVLLIDVDYDKQLVTKTNEYGKPLGDAFPVTDRTKLVKLLDVLSKKNDYAYIILDIGFEEGEETDADSTLYATISKMERIVIPCNKMESLADTCLNTKAGLAYYNITPIESDFVKYPYFSKTKDGMFSSMPLKMYEDITKRHISSHGFLYTENGRLVRTSLVLNLDYIPYDAEWFNLGNDLLYGNAIDRLKTKKKYIIIGSSGMDMHATYRGRVPGAIINFNAYQALMNNHHVVSPTLAIILFISFFIFSYLILSRKKISESLAKRKLQKNKWLRLMQRMLVAFCSWMGFSLYLSVLCITTYVFLDEVYDIFVTSTVFYIINLIVKLSDNISYEK
ncbi:CHASE2 domain-containing protein [Prevotella sp. E13-27]|uniref:CHASE2 domain-containing protein n=1 Tax=Prevotella sp. E13-27 TaxID=2938122 RepID=UPI00200A9F91|nr:CHASE2 domain-containing protein [Prevotella sp. E13-27]MCK8621043.1 CHASE2 domain-containing protein [Prevotella sp. E13-27]